MSRFPFRRPARWRKPPPPPAVPHIIESMDSRLYPLAAGTGAETTTWPTDIPIPNRPRSQSMAEHTAEQPAVRGQDETEPPTEADLTASPVDTARQAIADAAEAFRRGYGADSTEPEPDPGRELCHHCRGTGVRMTTNDLLRESIALLEGNEDAVIRTFYDHLMRQAPALAPLFPPDLLDPLSPPAESDGSIRTGRSQRDKLVAALAALANTYDPGVPEKMEVLDTHLAAFGRAHAAFRRPDGTVRGATVSEYHAVKVTLFATLHDAAAEAWLPEYDVAWDEAYEYAARHMLAAQDSVDRPFGRYPRS